MCDASVGEEVNSGHSKGSFSGDSSSIVPVKAPSIAIGKLGGTLARAYMLLLSGDDRRCHVHPSFVSIYSNALPDTSTSQQCVPQNLSDNMPPSLVNGKK